MNRKLFYQSLGGMLALSGHPLLVDVFPPTDPHNVGARILRLGMSVTAFASLERYIEDCFDRAMRSLATSSIAYAQFPTELREFITMRAVEGLSTRGNFIPEPDRLLFFETHIPNLAKYGESPPVFTALGFSPRGSNVNGSDVAVSFKALQVRRPWSVLATIAAAAGGSSVDLANDFGNLAKTRHRAAHNPQFNLPSSDLKTNIRAAISIGIAVDVLAKQVAAIWGSATRVADLRAAIDGVVFPMRFVDEDLTDGFVERATSTGRAVKRYTSEETALVGAGRRATKSFIIRRDASALPVGLAEDSVGAAAL